MQLGPYTVERRIEKYGAAAVCVARHQKASRAVLLTVISPASEEWRSRLEAVNALRHPGILPIGEIGETGDLLYTATPMLYPVLAGDRVLSPNAALTLVRQVGAALDFAHQHGIVHGRLHRLHIVRRPDGKASVMVRGFDLNPAGGEPADDTTALARIFYRALMGSDLPADFDEIPPEFPAPLIAVLRQRFESGKSLAAAVAAAISQLPDEQRNTPLTDQAVSSVATRRLPARPLLRTLSKPTGIRYPVQRQPVKQDSRRRTPRLRVFWLAVLVGLALATLVGGGILFARRPELPEATKVVYVVITATDTSQATLKPTQNPATEIPAVTTEIELSPTLITAAKEPTEIPTHEPSSTSTATGTATQAASATHTAAPTLMVTPAPSRTNTYTPSPSLTPVPSATLTPTVPPTAVPTSPNATVPDGDGAIMRTGPGLLYFDETTIEPGTLLTALERSDDNLWIKVRYQTTDGWVTVESLTLNVDEGSLPVATQTEIAAIPTTRRCVSVVGDSVTHGGVTFEVPATGYIIALTVPVAIYVEQQFRIIGINDVQVLDRGVSHTGISTANHPSYFKTPTYQKLLTDRCEFTIVMPWINDITPDVPAEEALPAHIKALASLIGDVLARNPGGRVLLVNYYQGAVAQFALDTWAKGFTPDDISYYNQGLADACQNGVFSTIVQVTCIDAQPAFDGMGISYVIGPITQRGFYNLLISSLTPTYQAWLDAYSKASPDGLLFGDGVHLSPQGKVALATYLVKIIQSSDTHF